MDEMAMAMSWKEGFTSPVPSLTFPTLPLQTAMLSAEVKKMKTLSELVGI
jgi:hypothetical protein